ncbi:hypothetical protein [Clostridium weizhouense]|uniref:Uncharacterized protein n=1 Tax=Clostridium weizhouense TaxID=2859781 RepID=A0ABS7AKN8_9CLOT|nr:hypothetical protein [Clostridium weizhouense]MBW6409225.1 hypothetical protein [Clostridium weizhouense]
MAKNNENNSQKNFNNINKSETKHENTSSSTSTDSSTQGQTDNTSSEIDINELMRQIGIINLSINTLYVIIISLLKNLDFNFWQRAKLIDQIQGTNYAENLVDKSDNPKVANTLGIYAAGVFLSINWVEYQRISSISKDEKEIKRAYHAFISSLLLFISNVISRYTFVL